MSWAGGHGSTGGSREEAGENPVMSEHVERGGTGERMRE